MSQNTPVIIDGLSLTLEHLEDVARRGRQVKLSPDARARVEICRGQVDSLVQEGRVVYGITTGIGKFCNQVIPADVAETLQKNIIRSHATAVGDPLREDQVRAVVLLRANSLARGHSGIRTETLETLLTMLNRGIHPVIPAKGSLGASGDLAPLAHMALAVIGEGEVIHRGRRMPAAEAFAASNITPVTLGAKEGLALINGTQVMAGVGALALLDGETLAKSADVVSALTLEALRGIADPFRPEIQALRPHPGQILVAENILQLLEGSEYITESTELRVQDPYSIRCIPQVHGATRDTLAHVRRVLEVEINSVTDNPLLFPETGEVLSGGNFHGQPLALSFDYLGCAIAEIGSISERRLEQLLNPALSGLPAFLSQNGGVNSGYMLTHYTAAALVSESKIFASPASVDSIPTSANQEDHVSMGGNAVRKSLAILENSFRVLAMEYLCAAQGVDLNSFQGRLGKGTDAAYRFIRNSIPRLKEDRVLYPEMNESYHLLSAGDLLTALQEASVLVK
jgi:histidine ammonia-lyase